MTLEITQSERGRWADTLIFAAHPDDIEFACAGSAARWVDEGERVLYCIATDGAAGSNDPSLTREQIRDLRREEQIAAGAAVGVHDIVFLDEPDGMLVPSLDVRRKLTRIIRQWRPRRVVLPDPTTIFLRLGGSPTGPGSRLEIINHPDHRAVGEAALYATFPSAETRPIFPELLDEGLEPHHVEEIYFAVSRWDNHAVDITPYLEQKLAAVLCHRSQVGESSTARMNAAAARMGAKYGLEFAETYRVLSFKRGRPGLGGQPQHVKSGEGRESGRR